MYDVYKFCQQQHHRKQSWKCTYMTARTVVTGIAEAACIYRQN